MLAAEEKEVNRKLGGHREEDEQAKLSERTTTLPRSRVVDLHHDLACWICWSANALSWAAGCASWSRFLY